jgi:Tfp pilus assembly protein PilX
MILVILVVVVGLGITSVTLSETFIAAGQNQASLARVYAEAGARDALLRLAKDKTYSCASTHCYTIDFATNGCAQNTGCARMSVSTASGTLANPKIITATGQVKNNVRRLQVSVIYDSAQHGEFATTTWTELTN